MAWLGLPRPCCRSKSQTRELINYTDTLQALQLINHAHTAAPLYLWYVAVTFLYSREFSLIILPWFKGNIMEIILNSCDSKLTCRNLNLQPLDPRSDSLATTPRKLMRNKLMLEVFVLSKVVPMAHWNFSNEIIPCTHGIIPWTHNNNSMDRWKSFHAPMEVIRRQW